jgi:hypothetical protein
MDPRRAALAASPLPLAERPGTVNPFSFALLDEHALEATTRPTQQAHLNVHQPRHLDPSIFISTTAIIVYVAAIIFTSILAAVLFCCLKRCRRKRSSRKQQGAILAGDGVPGRFPQQWAPPPTRGVWTGKKGAGRVDWGTLDHWHARC